MAPCKYDQCLYARAYRAFRDIIEAIPESYDLVGYSVDCANKSLDHTIIMYDNGESTEVTEGDWFGGPLTDHDKLRDFINNFDNIDLELIFIHPDRGYRIAVNKVVYKDDKDEECSK